MKQITPLDVLSTIQKRRSIRAFKPDPIEPELIKQLVELAASAPSVSNLQPWQIVVVQSPEKKAALVKACTDEEISELRPRIYERQKIIASAPITFVFATDINGWNKNAANMLELAEQNGVYTDKEVKYLEKGIPQLFELLGDKTREWAVKDAAIAATHLVLAAESLGLSSCILCHAFEDRVKEVIGASNMPDIAIAVLVPVGYAAESRKNPGRLPLSANVFIDELGNPME